MASLKIKAQQTFPPPFVNKMQTRINETNRSLKALKLGTWANKNRKKAPRDSGRTGQIPSGFPSKEEIEEELGGADGYFTLCGI